MAPLSPKATLWVRLVRAVLLILIAGFIIKDGRTYLSDWLGITLSPNIYDIGSVIFIYAVFVLSMRSVKQALKQLDGSERSRIPLSSEHSGTPALIVISRKSTYADGERDYRVLIDGQEIGRLANGNTKSFPVIAGTHTLRLKIDWAGSREIRFDADAGQAVKFDCVSTLRGWRIAFAPIALFAPRNYIRLERL